jgi:hypothetical protein
MRLASVGRTASIAFAVVFAPVLATALALAVVLTFARVFGKGFFSASDIVWRETPGLCDVDVDVLRGVASSG